MNTGNNTLARKIDKLIEEHETVSVIVMMIIAGTVLSHSFFRVYPLHTTTDELGAIVGAASLAGCDWSGVIDRSGYYGFGYYALFAPLFKLRLSPIAVYRIILIVTRIFRGSVISGIAYYIGRHYYKFSSRLSLMMLSLICTVPLHPNDDANIINDVVLDVFFWIIILSVCKIMEYIEKPGKCTKWLLIYMIVSFWSSFLHTRALVMIIASFLVLMGLIVYKRKRVLLISLLVIPATVLSKILISVYQNKIWLVSGEQLGNASVSIAKHIPIGDFKTWEIWLDMFIGHISVQSLLTGGLFLAAAIAMIKYFYIMITQKLTVGTSYINIILAISILSMGAAFAAFMVSDWFMGMYDTWDTMEKGKAYCYKAMCYVRYWNVFAMPFLYTSVYLLEKKEYQDCVNKSICAGTVLLLGFVELVVPVVQNHSSAGSFLYTYLTDREEKVTAQFYYKCILICMIFIVLAVMLYRSKAGKQWALLPIVVLMVTGYHQANENYNRKVTESISAMALSSYEQKCRLDESGVDIGQVYVYDDRKVDRNWYLFSVMQFYFYEYRIEDEYPEMVEGNDIIITYGRSGRIEADFPQLDCYQLDDNEVWYTGLALVGYEPQGK